MGRKPDVPIGTKPGFWGKKTVSLSIDEANQHLHIIGLSGSGKSRFIATLFLNLLSAGLPATLVDPQHDLAELVVKTLASLGFWDDPAAFAKLLYFNIAGNARDGYYLPFNVLGGEQNHHSTALNVLEAFHRAYPSLAQGQAPMFDTLVANGTKALLSSNLPLTALPDFLLKRGFRSQVLAREPDPDVVGVFADWYDKLSLHDQMDQAGSTIRRVNLLTFSPVLKQSLGQDGNALNFRDIMDRGQSVILDLSLPDGEARRLLGCLVTVAAEQGASSRAEVASDGRAGTHHLIIDEFSEFAAQSEEALSRMLSLTRKFGLFLVMAHQTWSQTSERLRGALQNVGLEVVFKLGRADAVHTAYLVGAVNPEEVKHIVSVGEERSHPLYFSLPEQWEQQVKELTELPPRHFLLKRGSGVERLTTLDLPDPEVKIETIEMIEAEYRRRYFVPAPEPVRSHPRLSRREKLEDDV